VALPDDGTPQDDVGKTVYALDVLADGTDGGERIGCGRAIDPVALYFPLLHRFATPQPPFAAGTSRVDIELGTALPSQVRLAAVGSDGP
jgi:hypothetical protein